VIGAVIDEFGHRNGTSDDMKRGNISEAVMSDCLHRAACGLFKFFCRPAKFFYKLTFSMVQILQLTNREVRLDIVKSITKLWRESFLKILKLFICLPNKSEMLHFRHIFVINYSLSIFARRAPEYHSELVYSRLNNI